MLMSLRLAPSSFELMLLSLTSPVLRCFDIVIIIALNRLDCKFLS